MAEGGCGGGYRPRVLRVQDQTCGMESTLSAPVGCSPCPSVKVLVAQFCLTLCNSMDCSPPGSSVHGILYQEYWSRLPCPSPRDLPHPEIEPRWLLHLLHWQVGSLPLAPPGKLWPRKKKKKGRLNSNKVPHRDLQRFIEKRDCQNDHDEIVEALSSHFQIMEFTFDS